MVERAWLAAAAALILSGCSLAPAYRPPATATPVAFKESGPWTPADPADAAPRGPWWSVFDDPVLADLESQLEAANPSLASALARYDQARAVLGQARGGLLPEIDAEPSAQRQRQSGNRPQGGAGAGEYDTFTLGAAVGYEVDLWGRIRNQVAAAGASAQASQADAQAVKLSLQSDLALNYMALRGADAQLKLLTATVDAYSRAFELTNARHSGGAASGLDVGRAETLLQSARAQIEDVSAQRALYEHAIATLVGKLAAAVSIATVDSPLSPPRPPVSAPSLLLQRRPDIAAAERRAAAANAQVGVARAALFPSVSLSATGGWQAGGGVEILNADNVFWTLGSGVVAPLFDNGRRQAGVRLARAQYEQLSADYRALVLEAFQSVEDQMALCNRLAAASDAQALAARAAERTQDLALTRYRLGAADYLEVVTAQTAALDAQQAALSLQTRRLQASVNLIRALGGGWGGLQG